MSSKSKNIWRIIIFLLVISAALALIVFYMFNGSIVRGTISYNEDAELPDNSTLVIQLQDVSFQDAPSKLISEIILSDIRPSTAFSLSYDRNEIDPSKTYAITASIYGPDDELLWVTDTGPRVITREAPKSVQIELIPVGNKAIQPTGE